MRPRLTLAALRPALRPALAALGAAAACAAPAAAHEAKTVLPGWWEYTAATAVSSPSTDHRCVKPDEIDKFMSGPSNGHYHCTYPTRQVGAGRARFVGVCVSKHGSKYPVEWSGTYAPERFDLHGTVRPNLAGLSIPVSATISAHRLSATCPTPDEAAALH